jgi:hypothetical protein
VDKEELIGRLDVPMKFQMVADSTALIENYDLNIHDLLEVSFHKKKEIAFRAAWMLEYIVKYKPLQFYPHIPEFMLLLPKQNNHSAQRHYTKIVALMTDRRSNLLYKEALIRVNMEAVIELLFTRLVDPETLVAAKVHCMQALANLVPEHDWIKEDLLETIDHLMEIESIAFFARAKMVKKQLKKHK